MLWASMWPWGIEPQSLARVASSLNCWVISRPHSLTQAHRIYRNSSLTTCRDWVWPWLGHFVSLHFLTLYNRTLYNGSRLTELRRLRCNLRSISSLPGSVNNGSYSHMCQGANEHRLSVRNPCKEEQDVIRVLSRIYWRQPWAYPATCRR